MREVVQASLKSGFEGNVYEDDSYSSHFFHLFMGMIPIDQKISYVRNQYGVSGEKAVSSAIKKGQITDQIKEICKAENILVKDLRKLSQRKVSSLTDQFIPALRACLYTKD